MINILPIEERKEIKKDYFKRFFIVALIFFASLMLMAVIMLLPTILYLNEHEDIHKQELEYANKRLNDVGLSQMTPMIDDLNKKIKILTTDTSRKDSAIITEIMNAGSGGIRITSLSVKEASGGESVYISGKSATRKDLLDFMENLKKCKAGLKVNCTPFDKIESPVSNLLKERDIDFTISAEVSNTITKK